MSDEKKQNSKAALIDESDSESRKLYDINDHSDRKSVV